MAGLRLKDDERRRPAVVGQRLAMADSGACRDDVTPDTTLRLTGTLYTVHESPFGRNG